jgi:pyruvate dehydrogenase E2 component (dihydrolipoamide acetyltransferase)
MQVVRGGRLRAPAVRSRGAKRARRGQVGGSGAAAHNSDPCTAESRMPELKEARVPDIGGYDDVPVIEVLVAVGDTVKADQGLVTLESDKATMEVPAPFAGIVRELKTKVGDTLSEGSVVALIEAAAEGNEKPAPAAAANAPAATPARAEPEAPQQRTRTSETGARVEPTVVDARPDNIAQASIDKSAVLAAATQQAPARFEADAVLPGKVPYASPAVRLFARELGVDLAQVQGSEKGGRITREDVQRFVKGALAGAPSHAAAAGGGLSLLPWPKVDFAKFGPVETRELTRIQKLSGANLARNWAMIPHVTQHDDADITELEALRVALNKESEKQKDGVKLTMLAFLIKASVAALQKYPTFNASLDASGERLTLKHYFHIGFAADTPNGLVVPVLRDCDRKGVVQIAREMGELAAKARGGKLGPADMQGGCFSISSLGGIGGTSFTPIVNAPEVAILGVSKSATKPVWDGKQFLPRLLLPLSLSYDHRVIDGAAAARFTAYLAQLLGDMRRVLL